MNLLYVLLVILAIVLIVYFLRRGSDPTAWADGDPLGAPRASPSTRTASGRC